MRRRPLLPFFALAYLFSWVVWAPLAAHGLGWSARHASPYLHLVGGLGPLVAAVVVTAACDGRAGLASLRASAVAVRGRFSWIAFAVAAPLVLFAVAAAAQRFVWVGQVGWADLGRSVEYPALGRGAYWVANIVCYGFGEEVGWRGFALPRLQARGSALRSALLVGVAWAGWHLPLFAFAGGLSAMGAAGIAGWASSILTGSMLMTWLFNTSRGSILAVALFHGVLDIVMSSPLHGGVPFVMGALITLCGISIPILLHAENLARHARVQALPA